MSLSQPIYPSVKMPTLDFCEIVMGIFLHLSIKNIYNEIVNSWSFIQQFIARNSH